MKKRLRVVAVIAMAIMICNSIPVLSFGASSGLSAPKLKAAYISKNSVKLSWNTVKNAKGYQIYRSQSPQVKDNGESIKFKKIATIKGSYLIDKNVPNNGTDQYWIRAYRVVNGKNVFGPKSKFVRASGLSALDLNTQTTDQSSIQVSWKPVKGATGYRIYRKISEWDAKFKQIAATKAVSYLDKGLVSGQEYVYCVKPYKVIYNTVIVGPYEASKCTAGIQPPSIVRAGGTRDSYEEICVSWWGNDKQVDGYQIYKADPIQAEPSYEQVFEGKLDHENVLRAEPYEWIDKSVTPDKVYDYKVRTFKVINSNGDRMYSSFEQASAKAVYGYPMVKAKVKNENGQVTDTVEITITSDPHCGTMYFYDEDVSFSRLIGDQREKVGLNLDEYSQDGIDYTKMTGEKIKLESGQTIHLKLKAKEPFTYDTQNESSIQLGVSYDNWAASLEDFYDDPVTPRGVYPMWISIAKGTGICDPT